MRDELRQSFALLPRGSDPWIGISKPVESRVKKFICRRSVPTGALSVKGPAKDQLCRTIMCSSHSSEPMVDKCGLPDTGPGNDCNDVYMLICPGIVQESDILLTTEQIHSCNGQSRYGSLLRSQFCRRLATYAAQSARGHPLQALMRDFAPCLDRFSYCWHRLPEFGRIVKTMPWVFVEK